ncbi:hypothetical protein HU200_059692 [Digitaria exilis]|uniref:Uncharacterized protein n=1 Tax=Digitaria exilis TaxID=1010633 RepID=A0A835ABD2_9POAL|nr:hypothetical protein HU200_059692 [Digitaria exilis]
MIYHSRRYCMDKVLYDASSVDWLCNECHQRHSEDSPEKSLGKVSSERPTSHPHFDTTSRQPITKRGESSRLTKRVESANPGSVPRLNRTGQSDDRSNIRNLLFPVSEVAVNQVSGLKDGSGAILSFKHTDQDKQTDQHASVICKNRKDKSGKVCITCCAMNKDKPGTHGDNDSNVIDNLTLEREKKEVRFQLDHEASNGLQERSMVAANGPQYSIPRNDTFDKAMTDLSNMGVLPKENSCLPSVPIKNDNLNENSGPSKLLDRDNSSSPLEISSGAIVLETSATEVEISDTVGNFHKDNPRKRRRLILDDDDEAEEKMAEGVQKENFNPQPPNFEPVVKHMCVEEAVDTGELNDENLINCRPVKRRRYIAEDEDDKDIVGSANAVCALNDATNWSLNTGTNMVPQTLVAADHSQQSSPSHSESDDQQHYVFAQPLDELVWRQNEVTNTLVNDIIQSDGALKLLIKLSLPSVFQGNHYLWGVFKRRKDMTALIEEQDGSGKHDAEQGQQQELDHLDRRDEALYDSSDQETLAVKHVVRIENQLLGCDHNGKSEAVNAATREGTTSPGSSWSSAKLNSPKVGSNCSVELRTSKLPGDLGQQTSLPEWNTSSTEQSCDSGSTKLVKPVEHCHGQPHSGSEPPSCNLFGFVAARTPRSQQLIQEMVSEGAILFPVPEQIVTTGSVTGSSARVVPSEMNPDTERLHLSEPPQALGFVPIGHGESGADSEACLELFPVRQERIGWAPRAEASRELDLDLSLGKQPRAPSSPPLF